MLPEQPRYIAYAKPGGAPPSLKAEDWAAEFRKHSADTRRPDIVWLVSSS